VTDKMPFNFLWLGPLRFAGISAGRGLFTVGENPIDTCLSIYLQHFTSLPDYGERPAAILCSAIGNING